VEEAEEAEEEEEMRAIKEEVEGEIEVAMQQI